MQSGAVRNRLAHTMVAGLFWLAVGGATEARASLSDSKMSPDMVPGCASSVSMRFIDHAHSASVKSLEYRSPFRACFLRVMSVHT